MTIIEQIKAEIERLKGICTAQIKANPGQTFPFVMEMTGYDKLLSFLSTLESEKPMQEGLEEEIAGMYQALFGTDVINRKERLYPDTFEAIARHFAEWGAEHLKK